MNEDAIRQVQKSTVIPPPKRTQEDIDKEIAEARKDFYYEKKPEETKKYGFQRSNELDALLKRKQKVAEVLVPTPVHLIEGSVFGSERGCHSPGPEIDCHSASQKNAGRHQQGDCRIEEGLLL